MIKKKKTPAAKHDEKQISFFEKLNKNYQYVIAVAVILIPLIYSFAPYIFENLRPTGTDIVASKGETNLYLKWQKESGETALWNPNIFTGMPVYHRITPQIIHVDSFINLLDTIIYWAFFYFLIGALGIFFLLVYKKIPWQISVVVAAAFTLLPDWQALLGDGHYTKLRAIMVLPWLILSFNYFLDNKSWFGAAAFAFIFAWMFRTQHFQIVFYGILILFFLFIYPVLKIFIEKKFKDGFLFILKFIAAILLTVMTSAQPFLSIREYAPYSTRGGNPVEIGSEHESAKASGGVSLDYAVQWSLAPSELLDFFIQRFHGGISGEIYDGQKYPQFKGQQVPGYWGQKPFSGNYHYMGMILFVFALLGLIKNKKDGFVIALGMFVVFSILLSFGRHFKGLYELFYYYVPFFSKFRAPSMMANITFIALLILSGYGIKSFIEMKHPEDAKLLAGLFGGAILFAVVILITKDSFSFIGPNEAGRYQPETINLLKEIRKEFLTTDTIRLLIIIGLTAAAATAFYFRKIKADIFTVMLFVLVIAELFPANKRAFEKIHLNNEAEVEANVFGQNELTRFLSNKPLTERLLVLGGEFQSNHYTYFHPTVNGYSAIKMQTIQDINQHNLFNANTPDRVNWNVINMLNGKYIITDGRVDYPFLSIVSASQKENQALYVNRNVLPKTWFVKEIKQFSAASELVLFMNDTTFNPAEQALMMETESTASSKFSGKGDCEVVSYTPNEIRISFNTSEVQFMVISEPFYPEGWQAFYEENELKICKVNHSLRGVEIPAGSGELVFKFNPPTFRTAVALSWTGNVLILIIFAAGLRVKFKK